MSKKYEQIAKDIVNLVGGIENINSLHHCQTRLRFDLKAIEKANKDAIEALPGNPKVIIKGGMYQVVIGLDVAECYEEIEPMLAPTKEETGEKKKVNLFDLVSDFISGIFSPIVPALAGAGMVKALLAFLVAFSWIDKSSQVYTILNLFGDATFAFMPILLAFTTAQKL